MEGLESLMLLCTRAATAMPLRHSSFLSCTSAHHALSSSSLHLPKNRKIDSPAHPPASPPPGQCSPRQVCTRCACHAAQASSQRYAKPGYGFVGEPLTAGILASWSLEEAAGVAAVAVGAGAGLGAGVVAGAGTDIWAGVGADTISKSLKNVMNSETSSRPRLQQ